ncbi:TetR family transcriptional regulator [Luteimonas cucumeris]|uniref:TetR family transcriptional regulator n=1 Tax=Luteimonas cucumeris TaxID=985012 RepID=A0A562LET4_9GAMM|nr:TetR/AcrR family transcriptional regulator [Luteimonas cucumeris]TWI06118.1 TetR family transcriptional regulator [Luteimonas cucumeris]
MSKPAAASKPLDRSKNPSPGRPKDLTKRAAILEAAKQLFTLHGYDGVSMDQIANEAGVSKLTVYSHFGDKDALFMEAIRVKCEEQMPADLFPADLKGPLRVQLTRIAQAFFALITSDEALSMHRMMLTQSSDMRVRQMFWQAGPQRVQEAFNEFLQARMAAGELVVPDIARAPSQFFCLLKGQLHMQMVSGLCARPGKREIDAHIDATVDLFLRAHEPR